VSPLGVSGRTTWSEPGLRRSVVAVVVRSYLVPTWSPHCFPGALNTSRKLPASKGMQERAGRRAECRGSSSVQHLSGPSSVLVFRGHHKRATAGGLLHGSPKRKPGLGAGRLSRCSASRRVV